MKNRQTVIRTAFGGLILVALLLYLLIRPAVVRARIEKGFEPSDTTEYKQQYRTKSAMEEMDIEAFSPYLHVALALSGGVNDFALPCDVVYYKMENGKRTEALTLRKGTIVEVDGSTVTFGKDFIGYPTFQKGWRYIRPLTPVGTEADETYYYVRTNVLEKIVRSLIRGSDNPNVKKSLTGTRDAVYGSVRLIDRIFYYEGIYCSEDLTRFPVESPDVTRYPQK